MEIAVGAESPDCIQPLIISATSTRSNKRTTPYLKKRKDQDEEEERGGGEGEEEEEQELA